MVSPLPFPRTTTRQAKSRQIRQHSRLINTLGERQTRIGVNRMECGAAGCKQERYFETSNENRADQDRFEWILIIDVARRLQTEASSRARHKPAEDHKCETGSSGEPSSELWASTCSTSSIQWRSRPRPARRPKAPQRLGKERSRPSRTRSTDDQVGRGSSDSATKPLKCQVLTIQATQR